MFAPHRPLKGMLALPPRLRHKCLAANAIVFMTQTTKPRARKTLTLLFCTLQKIEWYSASADGGSDNGPALVSKLV